MNTPSRHGSRTAGRAAPKAQPVGRLARIARHVGLTSCKGARRLGATVQRHGSALPR
ncbi:MAG: hypothetical protein J0L58_05245 [Burkholderiales bacterium]|nr:hypothetical protein [Burkholderiales bacterium]